MQFEPAYAYHKLYNGIMWLTWEMSEIEWSHIRLNKTLIIINA